MPLLLAARELMGVFASTSAGFSATASSACSTLADHSLSPIFGKYALRTGS